MDHPKLIILTNCTERKRGRAQALHLGDFQGAVQKKASRWVHALERSRMPRTVAMELYQGDHWTSVLALRGQAERRNWDTELWIASAGYGLVSASAELVPYAATFGGGHPDSVGDGIDLPPKDASHRWWNALSQWQGPEAGSPRTLTALAAKNPNASWLVAMSPTYLDAVSLDLFSAMSLMNTPEALVLVAGKPGPSEPLLIPHWIPALEISRGELGGSCTSLNARVGAHILQTYPPHVWDSEFIQKEMNLWMAGLPPVLKPVRQQISDAEAHTLIRKAIREDPSTTHSALLRKLRDSGVACEQKRFRDLFKSMKATA